MTIAAGFLTHEGILFCADSQMSTGWDKTYERKLVSVAFGDKMVSFAFAGNADHARSIIEDCREKLSTLAPDSDVAEFRKWIRLITRRGIKNYFLSDGQAPEFLIGITTISGSHHLFLARGGAMPPVDKSEFIGSGALIAHHLMKSINPGIDHLEYAALVAMSVVAAAKRSDPNCGGASQFLVMTRGHATYFGPHQVDLAALHLDEYEYLLRNLFFSLVGREDQYFDAELAAWCERAKQLRRNMREPGTIIKATLETIAQVAREAREQSIRDQSPQPPSPESPEGSDES